MLLQFLWHVMEGLASLVATIGFLFTGISFGCLSYARGYAIFSVIYFLIDVIIALYHGYYDIFILLVGINNV